MVTTFVYIATLLRACFKHRLELEPALVLPKPLPQAVRQLATIAQKNFRSGRYARLQENVKTNLILTPERYMDQMIDYWLVEVQHWDRLCNNDQDTFNGLRTQFERIANRLIYRGHRYRLEDVQDVAQRALAQILLVGYPFDVPFKPWTLLILKRVIWQGGRSTDLLDHNPISLDEPYPISSQEGDLHDILPVDPLAQLFFEAVDNRDLFVQALRRLNPRYAEVIALSIEGWTDEEIARFLNTSRDNVQMLRHRAREQFRRELSQKSPSAKSKRKHLKR